MSKQQVRLASLLLEEAFGDQVEAVGTYLLKNGGSNLGEISKGTGLQINKVMSVSDCLRVITLQYSKGQEVPGGTDPASTGPL